MTVDFWTFSKRKNSTARPSGNPACTFNCVLKDASGILRPVLEIYQSAAFNPSALNYARIAAYGRYYYASEWEWIVGRWEVTLQVDAMASYRTEIGNSEKYVLRSAKAHTPSAVDTLYPALAWEPAYYYDTDTFNFSRSFDYGVYILGIANRASDGIGAVTYYALGSSTIRRLVEYMLPQVADWLQSFTAFTDVMYRSIYNPFDYIKSCRWFPVSYTPSTSLEYLMFGNYLANEDGNEIYARRLDDDVRNWYSDSRILDLPTGWLSLEGKYRTPPYAHLYIVANPWGVIELNPLDFTDSNRIKCYVFADFISGDGILKIYKVLGNNEYFVTQKTAKISVDVNLSQASVDARGILGGIGSAAAGIGTMIATGGASAVAGAIMAGSGVSSAAASGVPSLSGSVGMSFDSAVAMEGQLMLVYQSTYFAQEDPNELGKPLLDTRVLSTLGADSNQSGYIKCADGDISLAAFPEEVDDVMNHLTGGFYYD